MPTRPEYYSYIQSAAWFTRTASVRIRNKGLCELCCLRYGSVVHHRTYDRLGQEDEKDLLHLCTACHRLVHGLGEAFIWPSKREFLIILQHECIAMNLYGRTD